MHAIRIAIAFIEIIVAFLGMAAASGVRGRRRRAAQFVSVFIEIRTGPYGYSSIYRASSLRALN